MTNQNVVSDLRIISASAVEALKQEAIVGVLRRDVVKYSKLNALLDASDRLSNSPDDNANQEFNAAINHAISLGLEGIDLLRYWREGDWDACSEFGFTSPQLNKQSLKPETVDDSAQASLDIVLKAGRLIRENNRGHNLTQEEEEIVRKANLLFGFNKWPGYHDDDE